MSASSSDALTSIFLSLRVELLAFARRRADVHVAEEIVQDAYLNLRSRANAGQWREPRAFLFRAIGNLAIDRWRVLQRQSASLSDVYETEEVACMQPNPETHLYGKQQLGKLQEALDELPEIVRHAFMLNRIDDLGHAEIAARLGVSSKTVQRHIERAMEHCLARMPD